MPTWLQHTLVLTIAAGCLVFIARDMLRALGSKASRLAGCGQCKGCGDAADKQAAARSDAAPAGRTVFLPADMLSASAKRVKSTR